MENMIRNIKVKCKYYRVMEVVENNITENSYNLIRWLQYMSTLSLEERYKEVNGISGRLEEITNVDDSGMYALNFTFADVTQCILSYKSTIAFRISPLFSFSNLFLPILISM